MGSSESIEEAAEIAQVRGGGGSTGRGLTF